MIHRTKDYQYKNLNKITILFDRSLRKIKLLCKEEHSIYPGHGSIGKASDVDRAITALETAIENNLLEIGEEECLEIWKNYSSASTFPGTQTFWVEWDYYLKAAIIQYDTISFAKLIDEHEH